ncbi:hypothetical protein SCMU_10620 [Sinomonas cyclohexanicum]|uniref:Uncharacterized protein n=1 Tax=Sinomonas cyclohexanicum TaxID=322009 RepID=A0ABM7PSU0_SINCY|nr:hypothetical protein [Corynebacterium cyclohexanicum]BCT75220.1 hypothetical protein SCMU_10620 [Corynebacterium cyclohexanicum]
MMQTSFSWCAATNTVDVDVGHDDHDAEGLADEKVELGVELGEANAVVDAVDTAVAVTVTVGVGVAHAEAVGVGLGVSVPPDPAKFAGVVGAVGADRLPATAVLMPNTTSDPATSATAGPRRTYLERRNSQTSPMTKPTAAMTDTTTGITPSRMRPTTMLPTMIQIFDALLMAVAPPLPPCPAKGRPH